MEKVFVYGTLKHNQPNFDAMKDEKNGIASFSTKATSIKMYPLVIGTKYNIPFLLCREGLGHEIRGEVYDVDANMLKFLDKFENHPNFYVRKKISVKLPNSSVTECWTYFLTNYPANFLNLQFFEEYDSNGAHGLPYVPRYHRNPEDVAHFHNWNNINFNTNLKHLKFLQ